MIIKNSFERKEYSGEKPFVVSCGAHYVKKEYLQIARTNYSKDSHNIVIKVSNRSGFKGETCCD